MIVFFYTHAEFYYSSIFISSYISYHQIHIYFQMKNVLRMFLIHLSLCLYEYFLSSLPLPFYYSTKWNTYSTKWIMYSIATPITPAHTNNERIVMKFIKIQVSKRWSNQACIAIHANIFYTQWFTETQQHQQQNNKHLPNESSQILVNIFNITDINGIIVDREIVH